jgi:hypothetical protein
MLLLWLSRGRVRGDGRRAQVKVCASAVADLQKKYGEQCCPASSSSSSSSLQRYAHVAAAKALG